MVNVNSGLLTGQPEFYSMVVDPRTPSTWYAAGHTANGTFGVYKTLDSGETLRPLGAKRQNP